MLADSIVEAVRNPKVRSLLALGVKGAPKERDDMYKKFSIAVSKAPKYVLGPSIVEASQAITGKKPSTYINGLPLCRLERGGAMTQEDWLLLAVWVVGLAQGTYISEIYHKWRTGMNKTELLAAPGYEGDTE